MAELMYDINGIENQTPIGQALDPACSALNDITSQQVDTQIPLHKRPRLVEKPNVLEAVNGYVKSLSPSDVLEEIKDIKQSFDWELKSAIKDKLTVYLKSIEDTGVAVNSLRDDVTQLTNRVEFIERASKDLTKLVMEKVPLVAPTNVIGEHRTLSSQAPKLPPPPPLVSAPDHPAPVTAVPSQPAASQGVICKTTSPVKSITQQLQDNYSTSAPQTLPPTVVTIDLTSDMAVDQNHQFTYNSVADRLLPLNKSLNSQNITFVSYLPPNGTVTNVPLQSSIYKFNQSQSYTLSEVEQNTYASPNQMKNSHIASAPISLFSDVHLLPVAQLPPVPTHPNVGPRCLPVQSVPHLTIAEAAEGVCLQWTITNSIEPYEPAKTYEIFSYASSEVTLITLKTYFPWKKVGEVAALPLPMACTLTHVQANNMYYFIVRSIDRLRRYSLWSNVVNAYVS